MNKIEQDIRKMQELHREYDEYIIERIRQFVELEGYIGNDFYIDSWELEDDRIDIVIMQTGSYSFHEADGRSMPIEYLWDEDWQEYAEDELRIRKQLREEEEQRKKAKATQEREKKERETYERLRSKFEGED